MANKNKAAGKVKTKAMDEDVDIDMGADASAPPTGDDDSVDIDVDGDGDADVSIDTDTAGGDDADAEEPLGAQVLRRMYEHQQILMEEYDEMTAALENESVKDHLGGVLTDLEKLMTDTEKLFGDEYPDLPPLSDSTGIDDDTSDAVGASSAPAEEPTGDEVVAGMETKGAKGRRTKAMTPAQTKMCKACTGEMDKKGVVPGNEENQPKPGRDFAPSDIPGEPGYEEHQGKAVGGSCQCTDPGCPACGGHCSGGADETVINVLDAERPEIPMCAACAADAVEHGFERKDLVDETGTAGSPQAGATDVRQPGEATEVYAAVDNAGVKMGEIDADDEIDAQAKAIKRYGKGVTVQHLGKNMMVRLKHLSPAQLGTVHAAGDYFKQLEMAPNVSFEQRNKSGGWHKEIDDMVEEKRKGVEAHRTKDAGFDDDDMKRLAEAAACLKDLAGAENLSIQQKANAEKLAKDLGLISSKGQLATPKQRDAAMARMREDGDLDEYDDDDDKAAKDVRTKDLMAIFAQQEATAKALEDQLTALSAALK